MSTNWLISLILLVRTRWLDSKMLFR